MTYTANATKFDVNDIAAISNTEDSYIGFLEWHTISDVEITRDDLIQKLQEKGLEAYIPRPISPSDAFRRATSELAKNNVDTSDENIKVNYLVREVYSDRKEIVRHIVVERINKEGKWLYYKPEEAKIRYDKENDIVEKHANTIELECLLNEAMELHNKYKVTYNSRHIREMVANILSSMSPISVRPSGGVYFVPKKYEAKLKDLIALINELGNSEGYRIPVISSTENKDMVRKKLKDHIKGAINEAADYLRNTEKINTSIANAKLELLKQVRQDYEEYKIVLNDELEDMEMALELVKQQQLKIVSCL